MDLIPASVAERLIVAARKEALWRGVLIGGLAGVAATVFLVRALL